MKKKELKQILAHRDNTIQELNGYIRTLLEGTDTQGINFIRELYSRMDRLKQDAIYAATFPASKKMSGVVPRIKERKDVQQVIPDSEFDEIDVYIYKPTGEKCYAVQNLAVNADELRKITKGTNAEFWKIEKVEEDSTAYYELRFNEYAVRKFGSNAVYAFRYSEFKENFELVSSNTHKDSKSDSIDSVRIYYRIPRTTIRRTPYYAIQRLEENTKEIESHNWIFRLPNPLGVPEFSWIVICSIIGSTSEIYSDEEFQENFELATPENNN